MKTTPLLLTLLLLFSLVAAPGWAQQVMLSVDTQLLMVDSMFRDPASTRSTNAFLPVLNLTLTGPLRPGSRLYLDLRAGLSHDLHSRGRESAQNYRLVLREEQRHRRVSARLGESWFDSALDSSLSGGQQFASTTREAAVSLGITEPSFPALTAQYSQFTATGEASGSSSVSTTTSSRISGTYEVSPLRFHVDQHLRNLDSSSGLASQALVRRAGVRADTSLAAGLDLVASLDVNTAESRLGNNTPTELDSQLGLLRLSATPTPRVALDAEFTSRHVQSTSNSLERVTSVRDLTFSARSEVLPGLQLNLTRDTQQSHQGDLALKTISSYADLAAHVDARNSVVLSVVPTSITRSDGQAAEQLMTRWSWTSRLDARTQTTLSWDRFKDDEPSLGTTKTTNTFLSTRYRSGPATSLGLNWLLSDSQSTRADSVSDQSSQVLSADVNWLPSSDLNLGARINLTRFGGTTSSRSSVPSFDLHWRPDSATDVSVNWRSLNETIPEASDLNRLKVTLVSARLTHRPSRFTNLSLDYRVLRSSLGPLAYERIIRFSFTTKWPR